MLEEVQVPPSQFIGVVGLAANPANRAGEDGAPRKIQMDIQSFGRLAKGATDPPRRQQSEGCLEQFVLIHGGRLPRRTRHHNAVQLTTNAAGPLRVLNRFGETAP